MFIVLTKHRNHLNQAPYCDKIFQIVISYVKKYLVISLLFFLGACGSEEIVPPNDLVPKEDMINFLLDLHLAEAKINMLALPRDSSKLLYKHYERYLFDKHNLEDSAYYQSFEYYLNEIEVMDEIYGAIVDSLNVMNTMSRTKELELDNEIDK